MSETKLCPYCAESIQAQAVYCKHCKKDIAQGQKANQSKLKENHQEKVPAFWERHKKWSVILFICFIIFIYYLGTTKPQPPQEVESSVKDHVQSSEEVKEDISEDDTSVKETKTLDVSYDEIMLFLAGTFPMESSPLKDGRERYLGTAENGSLLELIGSKDDISQASIILSVGDSDPETISKLSTITIRFLNSAVPGWPEATEWLNQTLSELAKNPKNKIEVVYKDKVISANFIPEAKLVGIIVSPK